MFRRGEQKMMKLNKKRYYKNNRLQSRFCFDGLKTRNFFGSFSSNLILLAALFHSPFHLLQVFIFSVVSGLLCASPTSLCISIWLLFYNVSEQDTATIVSLFSDDNPFRRISASLSDTINQAHIPNNGDAENHDVGDKQKRQRNKEKNPVGGVGSFKLYS